MDEESIPAILLNPFHTEFALLRHEFDALTVMLRRAVTRNDKVMFRALAQDALALVDELVEASYAEDRRRAKAKDLLLQGILRGLKQ